MATLLQALIGGVPTLVDSEAVARETVADVNGSTPLTSGMFISAAGGSIAPADAPTSKFALGYVAAAVLASAAFTYYTDGVNRNLSGLTKGAAVYLGTGGAAVTTPPEPSSGGGWQVIGFANSSSSAEFVPQLGYTRQ